MFGGNNDFFGNDVFDRFDPRGGRGRSGSPFRDGGSSASAETSDRLRRERSPLFTTSEMPSSSHYDDSDDDFFRSGGGGSNSPFQNRFSSRFPQPPQQQQFQRESSPGVEHVIPIHIETTPEHKAKKTEELQKKKNVISATPIPLPMETTQKTPQSPLLQRQESVLRTYPGDSHVAIPLPPPEVDDVAMETTPPPPPPSNANVQRSSKSPEKEATPPPPPPVTTFGGKQTKEEKKPPIVVKDIPIHVQSQGQRRGTPPPPPPPNPKPKKKEEVQQQQEQPPSREEEPQQQPPKKQKKTPLDLVGDVMGKVGELESQISTHPPFSNGRKDKEYLFLDEMLTRTLIELDLIETEGREDVRLKRKECIEKIQGVIKLLESKIEDNN